MTSGMIFDIKEFSLNDGEGIRTTVFMKGCPLSCVWCHNPEGLARGRELYLRSGCTDCGLCKRPCAHEECRPYGRCLHVCPRNLVEVVGEEWEAEELAKKLLAQGEFLRSVGGGVTFSGGEPLLQHEFLLELLSLLEGRLHRAVETSGYAEGEVFERVISSCDFVYMDIKLVDSEAHKKYCGVSNARIIKNAERLRAVGVPHTFRLPLIPGITDGEENQRAIAELAGDSPMELLPYNRLAPVKYPNLGREFSPLVDGEREPVAMPWLFKNAKIR